MTIDAYHRRLLEADGWVIECESPFEIRHPDGSFGSGQAAQAVLAELVYEDTASDREAERYIEAERRAHESNYEGPNA